MYLVVVVLVRNPLSVLSQVVGPRPFAISFSEEFPEHVISLLHNQQRSSLFWGPRERLELVESKAITLLESKPSPWVSLRQQPD